MTDADSMPVAQIFELCDIDPRKALSIIDSMTTPVVDLVELARFRAYTMAALKPFMDAGIPWHAEPSDLIRASESDTVDLCEKAVQMISKFESGNIPLYYVDAEVFRGANPEDDQEKKRGDAICTVLESLRPGRVQTIRGATKISYFKPCRVGEVPGFRIRDALSEEEISRVVDVLFQAPAPIGSLLATEAVTKLNGSTLIKSRAFREVTRERPAADPGVCVGILSIGADGTHFFEPA